jgi:CcmD family protein
MMRLTYLCAAMVVLVAAGPAQVVAQPPQQPPQQQDEFVPIDQLPPEEQMPAAPMVVAAYAFIWIAFIAYVFTLVRRLRKVEEDVRRLERGRG